MESRRLDGDWRGRGSPDITNNYLHDIGNWILEFVGKFCFINCKDLCEDRIPMYIPRQ